MKPIIKNILLTLRPFQWYKNLLVFLALIFSGTLFNLENIGLSIIAFISLCLISSLNYVVNDFLDKERDKLHPTKRLRPIASGKLGLGSILLLILLFFILSQLYNFFLKNVPVIDISLISINFVLRAVAGAFAIGVWVSSWLTFGVFFLALFLVVNKRFSELIELKDKATQHRKVLKFYSLKFLQLLRIFTTALLLISYTLYSFLGPYKYFFITLPVVFCAVFYFFKHGVFKKPELFFLDKKMLFFMILWAILAFTSIYLLP